MFCNKKAKLHEQCTLHLAFLQLKNNWKALLLQQGRETKCFECKAFMWYGKNLSRVQRSSWKITYANFRTLFTDQLTTGKYIIQEKIIKQYFQFIFWNGMHLKLGCFVFQSIMTLGCISNKESIPESSTANESYYLKVQLGLRALSQEC